MFISTHLLLLTSDPVHVLRITKRLTGEQASQVATNTVYQPPVIPVKKLDRGGKVWP